MMGFASLYPSYVPSVFSAIMKRPQFYVDFNELIESDLVALSASDEKLSSTGEKILLRDGLLIDVYSDDDLNDKGEPDSLIASGVVERNSAVGWAAKIRWCCRIDFSGHSPPIGDREIARLVLAVNRNP